MDFLVPPKRMLGAVDTFKLDPLLQFEFLASQLPHCLLSGVLSHIIAHLLN